MQGSSVYYDLKNGQQIDLVDDVVWDKVLCDIVAGEYFGVFASPDCSTFSKLHNLPGPPPVRGVSGSGRYGFKSNAIKQAEHVRLHTLVALRVAQALGLFTELRIPWEF